MPGKSVVSTEVKREALILADSVLLTFFQFWLGATIGYILDRQIFSEPPVRDSPQDRRGVLFLEVTLQTMLIILAFMYMVRLSPALPSVVKWGLHCNKGGPSVCKGYSAQELQGCMAFVYGMGWMSDGLSRKLNMVLS